MAKLQVIIYPGRLRASTGLTSSCKVEVRKIGATRKRSFGAGLRLSRWPNRFPTGSMNSPSRMSFLRSAWMEAVGTFPALRAITNSFGQPTRHLKGEEANDAFQSRVQGADSWNIHFRAR